MSDDRAVTDNIEIPENQGYQRTIVNYDTFVGLDENGDDVAENVRSDLTGYSFRGQVVETVDGVNQQVFTFSVVGTDLPNGEYEISLDAADILAKGPFEGWYDIFEQAPSGNEVKVMKGCFEVTDSATGT